MKLSVRAKRMYDEFAELVAIDSESLSERKMADCLTARLRKEGYRTEEDDAGKRLGGNAGNLFAALPGELPGPPLLFSAHMDTVSPGKGKRAVFHRDGRVTSAGDTVLGGDDILGIVQILEGIRAVREAGLPHRDIEILFPVAEELYGLGSALFDYKKSRAREAYVLDFSGPTGKASLSAPSILSFEAEVRGKAAHAGFEAEKGIHAINRMSRAVAALPQGRLDEETVRNIGLIRGGRATNIVPDLCVCSGEVRSWTHKKALEAADEVETIFREHAGPEAEVSVRVRIHLEAYRISPEEEVVRRFLRAAEKTGLKPELTKTFGGSDNNNFVLHGIRGIVLSCGMYRGHSLEEYTTKEDMKKGAELVAALITEA